MNINNELENKLLKQPFAEEADRDADYRLTAARYAQIENAIAVLSDMKTNTNYICHSGLSERLGIGVRGASQDINSLTGETVAPETYSCEHLLSSRECEILRLIERGCLQFSDIPIPD